MMRLRSFLFILPVLFLVSCASSGPQVSCLGRDWYEVGRREGAKGLPAPGAANFAPGCGFTPSSEEYGLYLQGRNAGLAEYCTPDNAFHLGKAELPYTQGVCPAFLEEDFLAALENGKQVSRLEKENLQIEQRIASLSGQSQRNPANHSEIHQELKSLKQAKRKNEKLIRRLVR